VAAGGMVSHPLHNSVTEHCVGGGMVSHPLHNSVTEHCVGGGMVSHPLHNSVTEHCVGPKLFSLRTDWHTPTGRPARVSSAPAPASKEADRSCGEGASRVVGAGRALAGRSPTAVGLGA